MTSNCITGFGSVSPPQDRVSQTYGNNWLASLQIDKISDASIRGILVACTKHLKVRIIEIFDWLLVIIIIMISFEFLSCLLRFTYDFEHVFENVLSS